MITIAFSQISINEIHSLTSEIPQKTNLLSSPQSETTIFCLFLYCQVAILFNNKMSCRILQNNHLYRRIETRNIFKTFSKAYKKQSLSRIPEISCKMNSTIEQQCVPINQSLDHFTHSKLALPKNQRPPIRSQRNQSQISLPLHFPQKYSAKLIPAPSQPHSMTTPIDLQMQNLQKQRRFSRECLTTIGSKNQASETMLTKWNQRRKNEDFKLKSCLERDKVKYESLIDETDFSTLQLKKRSEILSRREERYHQKWKIGQQRENRDTLSQMGSNLTTSKKATFLLSRYSKFIEEGLRSNLQLFTKSKMKI